MVKKIMMPLVSLLFLGLGVLLIVGGRVPAGVFFLILGVAGLVGWVFERRGAGGLDPAAARKPILLIATVLAGLGALVGALSIIFASSYTEKSFRGPDTPTEARTYGVIILVPCLIGVYAGIRSVRRVPRRVQDQDSSGTPVA
jgi:hypothetical protein